MTERFTGSIECTRRAFFGPTGVLESERGQGIGKVLLLACLHGLAEMGYAYGIIAEALYLSVGPAVIEDWNTGDIEGVPAIYSTIEAPGAAMAFHDLIFLNSKATRECFNIRKGPQYKMTNLAAADGNPLNIE